MTFKVRFFHAAFWRRKTSSMDSKIFSKWMKYFIVEVSSNENVDEWKIFLTVE